MSKAAIGARVQYCGHDGWFVADIFRIGDVNVVKANGKVSGDTINRPAVGVTHHLSDHPHPGCWCPERGIFVVPSRQVKELKIRSKRK